MDEASENLLKKKTNPIDRANVISRTCFCWLLPFFIKGYKRELTEDDTYQQRRSHDSCKLGNKLETAWHEQVKKGKTPSLFNALCKVFAVEFLLLSTTAVIAEVIRIIQPLCIAKLLSYYDENRTEENKDNAYFYAAMIILTTLTNVLLSQYFNFNTQQIGMKIRVAACSLIYRKSLKLSKTALEETTVGQMVNLISNDVSRFDFCTHFMYHLVMAPLETAIVMYLAYINVGWSGLVGIIFLLVSMPAQSYLGKKTSQFRLGTAMRTDERVRQMNEVISGIQVIKMYTWEKPFIKLVDYVRKQEMKFVKYISLIKAIMMSLAMVLNRIALYLSILTLVLTDHKLTSSYVYTMTSFYRLLYTVTWFFPQAVIQVSEMMVSVKRIEKFLSYEEITRTTTSEKEYLEIKANGNDILLTNKKTDTVGIVLQNICAKWSSKTPENNLDNISIKVEPTKIIAVVGQVGSGKSTLLQVILKELPPIKGTVDVNGTVSYASQEPWLFGGSVRQNILFGKPYNEIKYKEVVRVCSLEQDFALMPHGDQTLAGERGVTLSGGQRARINLARAVYVDADIYLLDDPLSAVDAQVGKHLFDECIAGYLKHKCVVLVTHQLQYLKKVDRIFLLDEGRIVTSGSYEDIKQSENDFSKMMMEEEEEESKQSNLMMSYEEGEKHEKQVLNREEKGTGKISWHVYKSYILAGGNWCTFIILTILFVSSQILDTFSDYFVTLWVNAEQAHLNITNQSSIDDVVVAEELKTVKVAKLDSSWFDVVFFGDYTIIYYSVLFMAAVVVLFSRSLLLYRWCNAASFRMHNAMFSKIIHSPMRFFNINPTGRILNRFSRDIGAVDETLPMVLLDTVQIGIYSLAVTIVVACLSPWILVPTAFMFVLFYLMRLGFLQTSRDLKRIEAVTRSPIYTHLSASLQGLTTIRAFGAQDVLRKEFDHHQNSHSAAFFMFLAANRTFGFWIDLICVVYVILVVIFLLFIKNESMGGNIGLGLTQAIALTGMLQWGMRQWSELENQMTSVERVQEYADLKPEEDNELKEQAAPWPQNGKIQFDDVSLKYSLSDQPVLKHLNFVVQPKEKVGIVGRTGAGKSSLIQALFRLTYIDGSILIDDVDTKNVSLNTLRSKISIIPQEPVLFSTTLRKNLDPFDEYQDDALWKALEEVELKGAVEDLSVGLDTKMAEGGSNFSVGQRQLVCLARAIVRRNKVLVLDEATANVDPHTDRLIQKTIRQKFADCSVLTIAHRLHTVMDSDKVLVMDAGKVVEFDHPYRLLQSDKGILYSLVMQTGTATAKTLKHVAEESYRNRNEERS